MTLTLAFDSFKGSLTSAEVADAFAGGVLSVQPTADIRKVCIADGGEGTAQSLVNQLGGTWVQTQVLDPLGRPITTQYGLINEGNTALIELAAASGLTLLSPEERNPLLTTTYGTGQQIADALKRGARSLLIGIGGSATNDGGMGLLQALGFRFLDTEGNELKGCGEALEKLAFIDDSNALPELKEADIRVACDVDNPLCGPNGAAHVFAPQKGADADMAARLDKGLHNYAEAIKRFNGFDLNHLPGAGAAGGTGGGLAALLAAKLQRGIDLILQALRFDEIIKGCDLVVTGEGRIDRQTLMGKAPAGILRAATLQGIPTLALAGRIEPCPELTQSGFASILSINPPNLPLETAMQPAVARENLRHMGSLIARNLIENGMTFLSEMPFL